MSLDRWLVEDSQTLPEQTSIVGLSPLSKALFVSILHQKIGSAVLVVTPTTGDARTLMDNLLFFLPQSVDQIHYIPPIEFDYYRGLFPNPQTICERNVAFYQALNDPKHRIFVTSVAALLQKCIRPEEYIRATRLIKKNDEVDRDGFSRMLLEAGYQSQPVAYDPGTFAIRGGVIDIFCPLYDRPVRLEFFGDLIEEIRFFEAKTQRSLEPMESVSIVPVGNTLIPHGQDLAQAALLIKDRFDSLGVPKPRREEFLDKLQTGPSVLELSFLFPMLSKGSGPLLDYFPDNTVTVWCDRPSLLESLREREIPKVQKSFELYEKEHSPIAEKKDLFLSLSEFSEILERGKSYFLDPFASQKSDSFVNFQSEPIKIGGESSRELLDSSAKRFRELMDQGYSVHFVCHTDTHVQRAKMLFETHGLSSREEPKEGLPFQRIVRSDFSHLHLWQGCISESIKIPPLRVALINEEDIFGRKKRVLKSSAWEASPDPARLLSGFRDLKVNDYVVHREQGIGRYLGLKSMDFLGLPNDYVVLEYKDNDKLYIPVYRLNVLQKYVGGEEGGVTLDKLGGERWEKAKSKAKRAVAELAAELLNIQAKRKLVLAYAFSATGQEYSEFEMAFPFDETRDQMKAIDDVMRDMGETHPMDRLICGDVGYGKTEVAMRAAYRAVLDSKQVAILVPTTVLAFQHGENFKKRFQGTAVRVEMVSRLKSSREIRQTLDRARDGKVDILIGTHRLLSSDVGFKDLGLLVIDEEHRFGVVHKEKLKKFRESVHVLSMTATPIPRTLNMAMMGIKDVSIIVTPPPDRLSVRTYVCRSTPEVIVEAITNEVGRGGQVFFVHNRIQDIQDIADKLTELLPKVSYQVVHGQMNPDELEKKMLSFYRGEFPILLTTAIIESGLDVPRANTILIDQAHHFGLAQIYQLRGRVGRSEKRAYCYLLVGEDQKMNEEAKQRLQVIQRYTDLGSGFQVASHDLEIRGSGDLLGKDQSGYIHAVGIDLYFELLEESIRAIKGEAAKSEVEPEISLKIAAYFPEAYIPDVGERVQLYRRLSSVESEEAVSELETEIRDRFGSPPEEVSNLLGLMTIKLYLKRFHATRMSCGPKNTSLQFAPSTPVSPDVVVALVQKHKGVYKMTPDQKLVYPVTDPSWKGQLEAVKALAMTLKLE